MACARQHCQPPLPFEGQLGPRERQLYDYWRSIHPECGGLPGRQHFDPIAVARINPRLLPHLSLVDVERNPLRFRLRLIGSAVRLAQQIRRIGGYLDQVTEVWPSATHLASSFVRIVETGEPEFRRGKPYLPVEQSARELSHLTLPLARDGRNVDMLLNVATYVWLTDPPTPSDEPT